MRHRFSLAAFAAAACITSPLVAQSAQRWSLQASGLYVGLFGNAYDGLESGPGGEVQVRVTPSLWSYGAGLQYSTHSLSTNSNYSVGLSGVFFEPRRVFDIGSAKYAPYMSGRLAYLKLAADLGSSNTTSGTSGIGQVGRASNPPVSLSVAQRAGLELSATGFQGNIGGGVLTRLSPRVNLDLGLTLGAIRFGTAKLKQNGTVVNESSGVTGTGQNVVVRAGLAIGLGGGAKKAATPTPKAATPRARK
jgi:hypothetical protein